MILLLVRGNRMPQARALLEQRKRPKHPPGVTLDLSSESFERCQEIYSRLARRRYSIRDGGPYIQIRFPDGFTPTDTENTDRSETKPT